MARQAIEHGAIEVAPVADQSYGLRQGRLADPFGHHWLIGRPLVGEARRLGSQAASRPPEERGRGPQEHRARHAVDPPALLRCAPR
jgi:hypothetical protein